MLQVIVLGIASFFTDISTEMVYPLLPIYLTTVLHAGVAVLGIIEGVAESIASLLKVFSGYISDRVGKRKSLAIFGYGMSWVGKICFYFAAGWQLIFTGRLVDRIGKGLRTAPRDALIADSTPGKKRGRAYGLHRAMDTLGAFVGVLAAIFLIKSRHVNYRNIFLLSIVPAFIGWLILFRVKESLAKTKTGLPFKASFSGLPGKLKRFLFFSFIFSLGNSSNQFLLLKVQRDTGSIVKVLVAYLIFNLTYGVFSYPAGKISDFIGQKKVLIAGYLIYGIVYWVFALPGHYGIFFFISVLGIYGFYMALTDGVEKSLVSQLSSEDIRGSVLGMHACLTGIGLLPASILAGFLWKVFGPSAAFGLGGTLGIIAAIGLSFIL